MVVYRVTPADVESGVRVGDVSYRGYQASSAGVTGADAGLKIGFFALLHDQDLNAPVQRVRPRRRRQRGDGRGRGQGVPEAVPQEPHRRRRCVPRQGRAADPGEHAGAEGRRSVQPARVVPDHQPRAAQAERRDHRRAGREERARSPVAGAVQAARELGGRIGLRRPAHLRLPGPRRRPAGPPRLRPGVDVGGAGPRLERRPHRAAPIPRHLRQLRDRRSRPGAAVALRAPVLDRREGRRHRQAGAGARPQRHDRPGRRRSPALHDAARRPRRDADRLVERSSGCRIACCASCARRARRRPHAAAPAAAAHGHAGRAGPGRARR